MTHAAADRRGILRPARLRHAWLRMLAGKQLRIETPPGRPVLATSLDLGGNVLIEVSRRGWQEAAADAKAVLLAEHRMRVDEALAEVMHPPAVLSWAKGAMTTIASVASLSGPLSIILAGAPPASLTTLVASAGVYGRVRDAFAAKLARFGIRFLARRGLGRLSRLSF